MLPILNKIIKDDIRHLNTIIIAPTRELAQQIDQQIEGFSYFLGISSVPIYGGGDGIVWEQQKKALETGAEIVVSSDWRFHANLEELGEYYLSQGISKKPIGFTKKLRECDVPQNFIWSRQWDLEQSRSLEILQYLRDNTEVTEWVAIDDLNMGIPQTHESWGEMEMDWGLTNFVLTTKSTEGIKQSGIKEKVIKYLM